MLILKNISFRTFLENLFVLLLFIGGANLFILIKTSGIDISAISFSTPRDITVFSAHLRVTEAGFIIGALILIYENYIHPKLSKNKTFLLSRIIWQFNVALIIIIPNFLIFTISEVIESDVTLKEAAFISLEFLLSGLFLSFFIYYYLLSILISFFRRLHQTFGQHIFFNYLIGKYETPLEENRVFMFIDLNDSTKLAEQLGHVKYSRMLNRCFDDIISVTKHISYEIYQFVGDEIVLSWLSEKDKDGRAFKISELVQSHFSEQAEIFTEKFTVVPQFKAAVSCGNVSATLVGDNSKSIAYHGDVLNTAARLLGLCKKYKKRILFSEYYMNNIAISSQEVEMVESIKLKGKNKVVSIYALTERA